jgi:hypothetical protein
MAKSLQLALRNANGLTQHTEELKTFISLHNVDAMLISKWKQLGITITKCKGYSDASKNSTSNKLQLYKTIFKPIWTPEYNSAIRFPLPI